MNHYHSITNNNNNNNTWCWCYSTKQNAFDATVTATLTHNLVFTSSLKQSSCTKHMKFYGQNDRMFVWLEKKKSRFYHELLPLHNVQLGPNQLTLLLITQILPIKTHNNTLSH